MCRSTAAITVELGPPELYTSELRAHSLLRSLSITMSDLQFKGYAIHDTKKWDQFEVGHCSQP